MNDTIKLSCWGCKSVFRYQQDLEENELIIARDRYGIASPECSDAFLKITSKEHGEWKYPLINRLTVDAYAVQHPPHLDIQTTLNIEEQLITASRQSVAIHLIALHLALEQKIELSKISGHMQRILDSGVSLEHEELTPPENLGSMKVIDVVSATTLNEHTKRVWQWADSAWHAWGAHHKKVREWYEKYGI